MVFPDRLLLKMELSTFRAIQNVYTVFIDTLKCGGILITDYIFSCVNTSINRLLDYTEARGENFWGQRLLSPLYTYGMDYQIISCFGPSSISWL